MMQTPTSARRPLSPRICNIGLDANALDLNGTSGDELVARFCALALSGVLTVVVAAGVRDEVQHTRTPAAVKTKVLPKVFNLTAPLNAVQQSDRAKVLSILTGNAQPGKHAADASHLSEAAETGCAYFITHDQRILNKKAELASILPLSLTIVTMVEFFTLFDDYDLAN